MEVPTLTSNEVGQPGAAAEPAASQPGPPPPARLSRRRLLERGGIAAGGVAALAATFGLGFESRDVPAPSAPDVKPAATATPGFNPEGLVTRFATHPELVPPAISVTDTGPAPSSPPFIFLTPEPFPRGSAQPGQPGMMIMDRAGHIVWFHPVSNAEQILFDLNVQTYQGKPVLTWWSGVDVGGHGAGIAYIADSSYQVIATVKGAVNLQTDLHEFNITPQDTALITSYRAVDADLSHYAGAVKGKVLSGVAMEVDIATGKVLFEWDSWDHVPLAEMVGGDQFYVEQYGQRLLDYFHINSVALGDDGDVLISSRNTSTIYSVDPKTGAVRWRLGGKKSDFTFGPGARFYFQHHVRQISPGRISVFDDGGGPPRLEPQSRGLILNVDTKAMHASVAHSYTHPARLTATVQGSTQVLPDGRVFVGWGNEPYFSEFSENGELLLAGEFPIGYATYRAFTARWQATPRTRPAITVKGNPSAGVIVYASWNGATDVAGWIVRAGKTPSGLGEVASQQRQGFETMIAAGTVGPYFQVVPYDASGRQLTPSSVIRISSRRKK